MSKYLWPLFLAFSLATAASAQEKNGKTPIRFPTPTLAAAGAWKARAAKI